MARSGYDIAMSVDPNKSNDVCTFCQHARRVSDKGVDCALGHVGYFRSISNVGPIYVSDCKAGVPHPGMEPV